MAPVGMPMDPIGTPTDPIVTPMDPIGTPLFPIVTPTDAIGTPMDCKVIPMDNIDGLQCHAEQVSHVCLFSYIMLYSAFRCFKWFVAAMGHNLICEPSLVRITREHISRDKA